MAGRQAVTQNRPDAGEQPGADVLGAPLSGFHWEFSDAENERFGDAIRAAIDDDEREVEGSGSA